MNKWLNKVLKMLHQVRYSEVLNLVVEQNFQQNPNLRLEYYEKSNEQLDRMQIQLMMMRQHSNW